MSKIFKVFSNSYSNLLTSKRLLSKKTRQTKHWQKRERYNERVFLFPSRKYKFEKYVIHLLPETIITSLFCNSLMPWLRQYVSGIMTWRHAWVIILVKHLSLHQYMVTTWCQIYVIIFGDSLMSQLRQYHWWQPDVTVRPISLSLINSLMS